MKAVKGFVKTCYSEVLVASSGDDSKDSAASKADGDVSDSSESMYLGGLGLKFKFPGDPKK